MWYITHAMDGLCPNLTNMVNVSVVPTKKVVNVCSTKLHEKMAKLIDMCEYFAKPIYLCGFKGTSEYM